MYKYIYIDDTLDKIEVGTINGIKQGGKIDVLFLKPGLWEEKITALTNILSEHHGLIVDLRLNDMPYEQDKRAQYRGSTVAQELRTLVKEKTIKNDIPIFLISADEKLHESLDQTSYDLFDGVINKNSLGSTGISYDTFIKMLSSFAEGYIGINKDKSMEAVFGIKDKSIFDSRFVDEFQKSLAFPNHVIIRFINKEVLQKTTLLVDEDVLAARLGIDKNSTNWNSLKASHLNEFRYSGILSGYFERWWWPMVDDWWFNSLTEAVNLRGLSASERVKIINDKIDGINLTPQKRSEKSQSDKFWVVCKASKVPIDTIDGFVIAGQDNNFPWQEKDYVCNDEALRPKNIEIWKEVATVEKNRLQNMKDFYGQKEKRVRR